MAAEDAVRRVLNALFSRLLHSERSVTMNAWNGAPVLESPNQPPLGALDFYRDYRGIARARGAPG